MSDQPPAIPPSITIIHSNCPNLDARCIRCKGLLRDVTLTLKDDNNEPAPFLIAYVCHEPHCTAFGLLTLAHIP